ncbi:ABC transporter ATP-binding protein [Nonomuraea sp. NPDC049480]|uniref:ABC transporter ATP-binding protein n=1 Tax=Nonomuraea sp. NPDC049480 TaxID=3364353 RepID=UPI00379C2E59
MSGDGADDGDVELVLPYYQLDNADRDAGLLQIVRRLPAAVRPVLAMIARAAPRQAAGIAALQIVSGLATMFGLLGTTGVLQRLFTTGLTEHRVADALPALAVVAGAYALRGAADAGTALLHAQVTPAVRRLAEGELFAAGLQVKLAAFDDAAFYDRMHRARDHGLFHIQRVVDNLVEMLGAALAVAAASGSMAVLHPVLLPVIAVGVLPQGWAVLRSARLAYLHMTRTVTMNRRVQMITDLATERSPAAEIRACQAEAFLTDEYARVADALCEQDVRVGVEQARTQAAGRTITGLANGCTLAALGTLLWAGWVPLAVAGAALIAVRTVSTALGRLVTASNQLFEQGLYVTDYQRFLADAASRTPARTGRAAPVAPGRVTLSDVEFRYPGNPDARPALRGVNLTLHAGQIIALVGENGSGKTTLAKIIAGLYAPTAGRVDWDGVDLRELDPKTVHDRIVMVMQEPVRWPHTARVNVRAGRHDRDDPGDRALREAATSAGADAVVAGLPHGWDTLLSKYFHGGTELSGGQWQRLAVARGLFRDAPLLIWDEPTAPLDARAEFAVYESLRRLAHGRTVILITHRLSSVRNADQIYLLHEGAVVEHGTHDGLLGESGRYAELYALQERMHAATP